MILDNLIAANKAVPMMMVMPDGPGVDEPAVVFRPGAAYGRRGARLQQQVDVAIPGESREWPSSSPPMRRSSGSWLAT